MLARICAMSVVPKARGWSAAAVSGPGCWKRGGELAAVVDELADEGEEVLGAGWGSAGGAEVGRAGWWRQRRT